MIYVDWETAYPHKGKGGSRRWCHMFSDTSTEELHAFASKIGLKREWLHNGTIPHYDLTGHMRPKAIRFGAREVQSMAEMIGHIRKLRSK